MGKCCLIRMAELKGKGEKKSSIRGREKYPNSCGLTPTPRMKGKKKNTNHVRGGRSSSVSATKKGGEGRRRASFGQLKKTGDAVGKGKRGAGQAGLKTRERRRGGRILTLKNKKEEVGGGGTSPLPSLWSKSNVEGKVKKRGGRARVAKPY